EVLQESVYEAELHGDVKLVCLFSKVKSFSDLTVIWSRVEPKPAEDVYRLERGTENHNYTSAAFIKRAQLIQEQLNENRAVLLLKKLRIKDSGMYRCIVKEGDDGDYKQVTLNVTAPYTPIKKSIMKTGQDEVELSCESQGFPSAQVIWSDGQNTNFTEMSNSSTRSTDEDLIHIISKLTVKRDLVNNYTCSFLVKGEIQQTATFSIPGELYDLLPHSSAQYAWIVAVVLVLLAIIFISVFLHRRKNGKLHCTFIYLYLKCTIIQLGFFLHIPEGQSLNISSILPDKKEIILLLGKPGSGKTSVAQILSSCWAESTTTDPFNISRLQLVFQVDCSRAKGDFFQVIKSSVSYEKPLDVSELRETLLGSTDCLLILDGYQEGNKDLDETLEWFLTERQTCRVLVTSHPGKCPALEKNVRTVLQLIQKPEKSGS
uniref:Si:ch211-241b2.5 n=1 Tax=Cyprinus carpio TaxID=7962 RepID=A0A8C2BSW5_CYPCA